MQTSLSSREHALRLATWFVLVSQALVFVGLVLARGSVPHLPSLVSVIIAVALLGSATLLAVVTRRVRSGDRTAAARWLAWSAVAGVAAFAVELAAATLTEGSSRVVTALLGLHAAHVAGGLVLVAWIAALLRLGRVHSRRLATLQLVGTYWTFVAGLWVVVAPVIPALRP